VLTQGEDVVPIPCAIKLAVRSISRSDQPIIFETANILQNPEDNMDARKIKLPMEDIQAVREVVDKANAAQGLFILKIAWRRCLQIRCI
jgi:hypothetical protein